MERLHIPEQPSDVDFTLNLDDKESFLTVPSHGRLHLRDVEVLNNTPTVATLSGQSDEGETVIVELLAVDEQPDIPMQVLKVTIDNSVVYQVTTH